MCSVFVKIRWISSPDKIEKAALILDSGEMTLAIQSQICQFWKCLSLKFLLNKGKNTMTSNFLICSKIVEDFSC